MHKLTLILLLTLLSSIHLNAQGRTSEMIDQKALSELQSFLNNPSERGKFSKKRPRAKEVNGFFESFPEDAQADLNDIVMSIMRESKDGASKHVQKYNQGGIDGALNSFSPEVQKKIKALTEKLTNNPNFNNAENLKVLEGLKPNGQFKNR